ncbi:MAG: tetratricopeptide repeat protein [Halothece sp.]|jgi:tetratricopeptide (TPR) repeat protein
MDHNISQLLQNLRDEDETVRQHATAQLWRIWFQQKGMWGLEQLRRAQKLIDQGNMQQAEALLTEIIEDNPTFAEARNRRAVLYYLLGEYEKSRSDCLQVVQLNQFHFGAWHGLGLSHAALGNYQDAIAAFRKALKIQPYAVVNQKLILECTMKLPDS